MRTLSNLDRASLMHGFEYISDTAAHTAGNQRFACLHALTDTVVDALTGDGITGDASGMAIKAGDEIFGSFTSVTLTSGSVIAYKSGL